MASYVTPKKNAAFVFYISLEDQANPGLFKANPTLAAGDVKVATDDGAPANLATLPAVDADFTRRVKVDLSAAEMNGDNVTVIFSDAAGAEWYDLEVNIQTSARQIDDLSTLGGTAQTGDSYAVVTNATYGLDKLARTGADSDTLKTLSDQIDGVGGAAGSGAITYTFTINDGVDPIDGAEVWVSTDALGSNVVAGTLSTDALGQVVFTLDAGAYYVWVQAARYNGTNPTAFTVS